MTISTSLLNLNSTVENTGVFGYTGPPGAQGLFFSVSALGGTDPYGNQYSPGVTAVEGNLSGMTIIGSSLDASSTLQGSTLNQGTVNQPAITGGVATSTLHVINTAGGGVYSYAQNSTTVTYTTSQANGWTCPTGVTHVQVQCWGAGAGGGGGNTSQGGEGGGGGEYAAEPSLAVTPGNVYTITVGTGGAGGQTGNAGTSGGDTIFGSSLVYAHGGQAGYNFGPGAGGNGSSNTIEEPGGTGGDATVNQASGGCGGGSSGGTAASGNNGTDSSSSSGAAGGAAVTGGGAGGAGGNTAVNGTNGSAPGGAGGGAGEGSSYNQQIIAYHPTSTASYYGSQVGGGLRNNNGYMYQGCASGDLYATGDQVSFANYNYTQIRSDFSGYTIDQVVFYITNVHSWYNTGMYVVFGWATSGGNNYGLQWWIDEGVGESADVSSALNSIIATTFEAIILGPSGVTTGGPTDLYNYGYFQGSSGAGPTLTVTGHIGTSGSYTAGSGAAGKMIITYTSTANTTLNASVSAVATTDSLGNTIPVGVMAAVGSASAGSPGVVAIQPGSSPAVPEVPHTVTYLNSWTNAGGTDLQYMLMPDGLVHINGRLTVPAGTSNPSEVCSFPSAYWPAAGRTTPFVCMEHGGTPYVGTIHLALINTSGNLNIYGALTTGNTLEINASYSLIMLCRRCVTINAPNPGLFQQQITQAVVNVRNNFQTILNLNNYVTAQGGVTFLEGPIGMSPGDASVATSTLANLAVLANVYQGSGSIPTAFNYMANGELLWGGQ